MDFQRFLQILWSQNPSGDSGFEGLIRQLLEILTGQRFFLSLSGRQEGRDMANEGNIGNFIAVECKRYDGKSSLTSDELLIKLVRAAISLPIPDIWIIVSTKRLGEQHHRDLEKASDKFGISYLCIDADGEEQSLLTALCACSPGTVADHLMGNLPKIDKDTAIEIKNYLSRLAEDSTVIQSVEYLRGALLHGTIGYADWRIKQNKWLMDKFSSPQNSKAAFGQNLAVHSYECQLVTREKSRKTLDDWWAAWQTERNGLVILGEEGDGKSWAAADWVADHLRQENFPPVVFIPSTHIKKDDPSKLVIQAIEWQIGQTRQSYWERRIDRWINYPQSDPVFLLVIDGLNERPGFNWRQFLLLIETTPFADRIAVLMTCRSAFWSEQIGFVETKCESFMLPPYDEEELGRALLLRGYLRDSFDDKLLPLLSKPRYFDLTIKLQNRLSEKGEVTVERLIYEDWRDQISRKTGRAHLLSNEEFQELITGLSRQWIAKGMLERKDVHEELSMYGDGKALLDELKSGSILRKDNNKWHIDSRYLILGLGIVLADEVEQTVPEGDAAVDELIASRLEPQPDMDLKVSICGMSFLHSLCREAYPDAGRLALFRAWIRGRNIQTEDWQRIPAYFLLHPHIYFKMAEYIWSKAGENREAQDAFMSCFLKYGREESVLTEIVPAFERWMGFVHPDGHYGRHARNEEERNKSREEVRATLNGNIEAGGIDFYGYPLEITDEEGLLRLAAVALSVMSHQKRTPYIRALTIYALASTIMGYPGYQSAFDWVIRTSPDDIEDSVLSATRQLMDVKVFVPQRAAWWFLSGLYTEKGIDLRNQIPSEFAFKNVLYELFEKEPCGGLFLWDRSTYQHCIDKYRNHPTLVAKKLKEVALDPELPFPEEFVTLIEKAGKDADFSNVRSSRNPTAEDLALEKLESALCAWMPGRFAEIWYYLASLLPARTGLQRRLLAFAVYDHLLIMGDEEMKAIENAWQAALESEGQEEKHAESILFPCVLWGKDLEGQLDLFEKRGHRANYFGGHQPRIQQLKDTDAPMIAGRLKRLWEPHPEVAINLLGYIAEEPPALNKEIKDLIYSMFDKGGTTVRGFCLEILTKARETDALHKLIQDDWRVDTAGGDYEKRWGSMFLCKYGTEVSFKDLVGRILPEKLGYAIQCRGNRTEEIAAYGKFIYEIWKSIAANEPQRFHAAERTRVETAWVEKAVEEGKNWQVTGDNEARFTFKSSDSIWGGGCKEINAEDMKNLFNYELREKKHNEANKQLYELAKFESKSGNPWFLRPLDHLVLEDIIDMYPGYAEEWVEVALKDSPDSYWLLARCRSFYESLCKALLNCMPELGVRLFNHLCTKYEYQLSDSATEIDSLLFSVFAAKESKLIIDLRHELIENCTTDKDLFEIVFLVQFYGRQDWLLGVIDTWMISERRFDRARGLTVLGFMDTIQSGDRLREWIDNHRESWCRNRAERALQVSNRNAWAKKWFTMFLSHEDNLQAWAAFRLFLQCADRRFWLWGPEKVTSAERLNRIDYYEASKSGIRKAALKNENNTMKLEQRLVFSDIQKDQTWPWMEKYFS